MSQPYIPHQREPELREVPVQVMEGPPPSSALSRNEWYSVIGWTLYGTVLCFVATWATKKFLKRVLLEIGGASGRTA